MGTDQITIVFESNFSQPDILYNVKLVEIKRDKILVIGSGYKKLYFKDKIKNITADSTVKIFVK